MDKYNKRKKNQLGMDAGTAANRLKKIVTFDLLKQLKQNYCYQCSSEIESAEELSIEHIVPWLDSETPNELFFSLDNIAFSHYSCNIKARRPNPVRHPSPLAYKKGCRCEECKSFNALRMRNNRQKHKEGLL